MPRTLALALSLTSSTILGACTAPAPIPATTVGSPSDPAAIAEFVALADEARRSGGCSAPLIWHDDVAEVALAHSEDMRRHGFFNHVNGRGETPMERVQAASIPVRAVAENIAHGQPTGRAVFESWRDSPGHSRNMLNCEYTHHGVGLAGTYWTHVLVRPAQARRR